MADVHGNEYFPKLRAVSRRQVLGIGPLGPVEMSKLSRDLEWSQEEYSHRYRSKRAIRMGNFCQEETIHITSPSMPLRDIEPASSTRNYQLLREWISTCVSKHEEYRSLSNGAGDESGLEVTALPTRVIDVGIPGGLEHRMRLLVTGGLLGQYVCLNYCGGKTDMFQTSRATLQAFPNSVADGEHAADLPRCIRGR